MSKSWSFIREMFRVLKGYFLPFFYCLLRTIFSPFQNAENEAINSINCIISCVLVILQLKRNDRESYHPPLFVAFSATMRFQSLRRKRNTYINTESMSWLLRRKIYQSSRSTKEAQKGDLETTWMCNELRFTILLCAERTLEDSNLIESIWEQYNQRFTLDRI